MDETNPIVSSGSTEAPLFLQKQRESIEHAHRLNRLLDRVRELMKDGRPRTLRQISDECGGSEASCSARLRELRAQGWEVDKHHHGNGLYLYHMTRDDRGPA